MPPKKQKAEPKVEAQIDTPVKSDEPAAASKAPNKRKKAATDTDVPRKEARRSGRSATKAAPSHETLLNFMLSTRAEEICRPENEDNDIKSRGPNIKTHASVLNPFEELLCAVILSRPISHMLGLRTIRTVLNAPYNFNSAQAVKKAGRDKAYEAVVQAHTQHKDKTADEISQIGNITLDKFTAGGDKEGKSLQRVLDEDGGDVDKACDALKTSIKGFGETGLKIFLRRVQWLKAWSSAYPYVDNRTGLALKKLGLPDDAEELRKALEGNWSKLDTKSIAGEDAETKKRRAFVVLLERAVYADLEGKTDSLLEAVSSS